MCRLYVRGFDEPERQGGYPMNIPEHSDRPWKGLAMDENSARCLDVPSIQRCSVWDISQREADEFKWIESEKAGRDLGDVALKRWVRDHWWGFLRARWVEHLQGSRYWIELDHGDFGLLGREFHNQRALLDHIIRHIIAGKENLDILHWAEATAVPVEPVIDILERLDINGHRLVHQFDPLADPE